MAKNGIRPLGEKANTHLKEGVIEVKHICAHEIFGLNSTENHDVTPNSLITKDTNTAVSIETSKGLRYLERISLHPSSPVRPTHLVVKAGLLNHGDEDVVSLAGDLYSLLGNVAEDANSNARAREGVPIH